MWKVLLTCFLFNIYLSFSCYGQSTASNTHNFKTKYRYNIGNNIPLGVLPMQYNSSFAGEAGVPRLNTNVLYQNSGLGSPEANFFVTYDQFIPAIGTGIGITGGFLEPLKGNIDGGSAFVSLAIAPKFSIGGKYTLSPSISLNYDKSDQVIMGVQCIDISGNQVDCWKKSQFIGTNAALLLNSNKFYIGYSVNIYSRILASRSEFDYVTSIKSGFQSDLQIGYTFENTNSTFSVTPQIVIGIGDRHLNNFYSDFWNRSIINYRFINNSFIGPNKIMLNFRYNKIIWGASDVGLHLGWQNDKLKFMVSNNLNFIFSLNSLPGYMSSTHPFGNLSNFSFRYIFNKSDKSTRNW